MKINDSLKTALAGLKHAKTRAVLTMLGIVIGIASVILLMSIGTSAQNLIISQVQNIGSNLLFVIPGATQGSKFSPPASAFGIIIKTLKERDLTSFRKDPAIEKAAGEVHGQARAIYSNNDISVTYTGATGEYFEIINLEAETGRLLNSRDDEAMEKNAVVGSEATKNLFGQKEAVGKSIRLKNHSFKVVGVLKKEGAGMFGADLDNTIFIPMSVAQKQLLGIDYYGAAFIQGSDSYSTEFIKSRITSILRQNHNITNPDKDDFEIRTQEDALAILGNITSILKIFLASIAAISLIVGGIGIMNIMLVSVIERTREIGLRKAVGATNGDIMQQFLTEAIILTSIGGLVGIIGGAGFSFLIYLGISKFAVADWTFALPMSSILLALGVSTSIGLIFGIYPARQASKKNPVEALRYE
ncbi:MAG: ABC transporter permease [bacterium]|nr:ABC transporter permease [bacterium]